MNDMRDRLVELMEDIILSCKSSLCVDCEHLNVGYPHCMGVHFADHLIENGVTSKQMVYFPFPRVECDNCPKSMGKDRACEELELLYDGKHPKYKPHQGFDLMCEICPWEVTSREYREKGDADEIGKTMWFSKEQAEQKLKEMRGE